MTRTHHAAGPGAPDGGGGSDDQLMQRLSAVLRDRAALAPEAPPVRAAADALGALRRRRRQRAQAGALLGVAGLLAFAAPRLDDVMGAVRPPALAPVGPASTATSPVPSPTPSMTAPTSAQAPAPTLPWLLPQDATSPAIEVTEPAVAWNQDDVDAFYGAGYTYADAVALAEVWQHPGDATYAKVTGGADLRGGASLPVAPGSTPDLIGQDPAWGAFTAAGYDVEDALELAQLWQMSSGYSAALRAGRELTEGVALPELGLPTEASSQGEEARQAWVAAGHDDQDAQELAGLWALGTSEQAVLAGGHNLRGGQTVPVQP